MAAIVARKRTDGSFGYKVQWRLDGRRDGAWQSETFDSRLAAAKFQAQVEAHGGLWPEGWVKGVGFVRAQDDVAPPVGANALLAFGEAYVRRLTSVGPYTQTRYLRQVHKLVGWLRTIKGVEPTVQNVTADDDRDWINARRRAGMSPKTIANYHGLLSGILKDAMLKGLTPRNPCDGVRLPPADDDIETDADKTFLTEDEFTRLLAAIDPDAKDLLRVAVGTGMRWSELSALRISDLDLDTAVPLLSVRRAWKVNGSGEFALTGEGRYYLGRPKTRESRRRITLAPTVVAALRRAVGDRTGDALVFLTATGSPVNQTTWYKNRWRRAVDAARKKGLTKDPRFHDLRHTHAAWLISAGVPLPVIQKRLGHKSIQITVDVYGGLLFQTHQVADLAIERALGGEQIVTVVDPATAHIEAAMPLPEAESA